MNYFILFLSTRMYLLQPKKRSEQFIYEKHLLALSARNFSKTPFCTRIDNYLCICTNEYLRFFCEHPKRKLQPRQILFPVALYHDSSNSMLFTPPQLIPPSSRIISLHYSTSFSSQLISNQPPTLLHHWARERAMTNNRSEYSPTAARTWIRELNDKRRQPNTIYRAS